MGNIGMYASGIPLGYMVDHKGPRPGVAIGCIALGAGFYPIYRAFVGGVGSMSVFMLCFFSFLTGFGSCGAFQAAIKTSALNWPLHRGTATAFPLAAFGLSAVFFTTLSHIFLGDDVAEYLLLLAIGTVALTFTSFFFVTVPHDEQYQALAKSERVRRDSNPLQQRAFWKPFSKVSQTYTEPGKPHLFLSCIPPQRSAANKQCQS
jgi:MFS family permease